MDRNELEQWTGREVARLLALLETERRYYQEILTALPIAAAVVTNTGKFASANRAFRRLLGTGSQQFQRQSLSQILPSARLEASVRETLKGATPERIPINISGRSFLASVTPVRGWDDDVESLAVLTIEEASSTVPIAPVVPSLPDLPAVVWTLDPDTLQFASVEGADKHLLGYSSLHWQSTPGFRLDRIHVGDRSRVEDFYREAIQSGVEFGCEFRAVTADSKIVWCRDTVHVVRDEAGNVARIHGLTTDVTSRRQAELDNLQANRVDALLGLSRRLSHDLNNALMIVTGYSEELLATLPENDARRADVQAILSAAEGMAGIAGELHGFTRKQASPAVPTDVSELLTEVAARIREELGATLVLRVPSGGLWGLADSIQLEAALISVARRLRDKTDPHMIITAGEVFIPELSSFEQAVKPGQYVEICLRGPYVCEVPASAFESLLSGKDSHESDLARTYAIVREWGGSMFTGRTEHTSEVRVLLPAVAVVEQRENPAEDVAVPPPSDTATVLVVEDEKGIRALVRKILTREGYTVLEASSAEEALEVARRHRAPIHLLLADMILPGKSGHELAGALQASYPNLRVVYI
jgi:PAS domain-containing protein